MPTVNQSRLDLYLAAEAKILMGQSTQLGDRRLQMADLAEVRKQITALQAAVAREGSPGGGSRFSQADFSAGTSSATGDFADPDFGRV